MARSTKKHGFIWWLLVGWCYMPFKWLFYSIPRALFKKRTRNKNDPYQKILDDSSKDELAFFVQQTKSLQASDNPDGFFTRLRVWEDMKRKMNTLSHQVSTPQLKNALRSPQLSLTPQKATIDFIEKYYSTISARADSMKTKDAKENQYNKFYEKMKSHYHEMDKDCINLVEKKYTERPRY